MHRVRLTLLCRVVSLSTTVHEHSKNYAEFTECFADGSMKLPRTGETRRCFRCGCELKPVLASAQRGMSRWDRIILPGEDRPLA